ncbi:MAG TPA: RNA polymerase sigma factor [Streptosporangiaceae bacterium]|nr:RNA polymerase sigma factor [Streptosporangiaceae bacterium]
MTGAAGSAGPSGVTDGGGAGVAGADTETRVTAGAGMTAGAEVGLANAVGRAQQGDAEAFRLLYRDIQPRLLRYLHAIAGQDAEDIASETWLQVTRDLPGFTGTYDGFRGWVATIARHRALDHLRRNTRRPPALALPAEDLAAWPAAADTEQSAIDAVATGNAVALIATLPPDQAEAVLLRAVLGLDAATAGQVLGKRAGAVRTAAHRGLKTLHKKINRAKEPPPAGVRNPAGVTQTRGLTLKDVR